MLARLWKGAQWGVEPAPPTVAPNLGAPLPALTIVPEFRPQPLPQTGAPKRRRKRIEIRIPPTKTPRCEPREHAAAVLNLIKAECTPGWHIPQKELERMYPELCAKEGWEPRHWTAIARHLGEMMDKRIKKEAGKKFVAYRVPKS